MRYLLPLLLVAGCGSGSSNTHDMAVGATTDLAVPACARTLDAYCATQSAGYCIKTLAAAQQPAAWCPDGGTFNGAVTLQHCGGGLTVIIASYADNSDHFVYNSSGALVAVFSALPHQEAACVGGPGSFAAPASCDAPTTLCS